MVEWDIYIYMIMMCGMDNFDDFCNCLVMLVRTLMN